MAPAWCSAVCAGSHSPTDAIEIDQGTRHRRRAAWVPVELPGLAAERKSIPREVVEAALAHTVQNPTEAAYARSDLFERRRRLMDDWASAIETRQLIL